MWTNRIRELADDWEFYETLTPEDRDSMQRAVLVEMEAELIVAKEMKNLDEEPPRRSRLRNLLMKFGIT